eukprot:TRINITY_DN1986_c0_g1_i1.p1 TRINITY_DN1986_c0_g1~~TRINITY_DN1986_c0_g1_i1.p1  ORF type:complete len:557 (-),score=129.56 TRINITY_DN1986_c0_g1_i1:172-1842(-)
MKKLSKWLTEPDWENASNYVAKSYTKDIDEANARKMTFDDVAVQMVSKDFANKFNKLDPPKKVDFMQGFVIEMKDGSHRWFCVERYIEGEYIKFNSNAGFVELDADHRKNTPQAFTHATFELSDNKTMVCDIQGVNELYTDPQVHTYEVSGLGGEGNLGVKGFALFFYTHECNALCRGLNLKPFQVHRPQGWVAPGTLSSRSEQQQNLGTIVAKDLLTKRLSFAKAKHRRSHGGGSLSRSISRKSLDRLTASLPGAKAALDSITRFAETQQHHPSHEQLLAKILDLSAMLSDWELVEPHTALDCGQLKLDDDESDANKLDSTYENVPMKETIIGAIHLQLALYHELGSLPNDDPELKDNPMNPSPECALHHCKDAAMQGSVLAQLTLAALYNDMPRAILKEVAMDEDPLLHWRFARLAADRGSRAAMVMLASFYETAETGDTLPEGWNAPNWSRSVEYYRQAVDLSESNPLAEVEEKSEVYEASANPYDLLIKLAQLYKNGGNQLERDPAKAAEAYREAAEHAMAMLRGSAAAKCFMWAEELEAELDNDQEEEMAE